MSADWQIGDLAVCVDTGTVRAGNGLYYQCLPWIKEGCTYVVAEVLFEKNTEGPSPDRGRGRLDGRSLSQGTSRRTRSGSRMRRTDEGARMTAHSRIPAPVRQWPELHRWPVHRDYLCCTKPVRVFDTWSEASTFAMANGFFMGEPKRRVG